MGWFDDQIKYRKEKDDECFVHALEDIAGAVLGQRLTDALSDTELAHSAVEEILKSFHLKMRSDELPRDAVTLDEQLEFYMRPYCIMRRQVYLSDHWYRDAIGPMLGTLKEDGSAVALIPGKLSGYSYLDLKTGERVRLTRKTEALIDREATCFYKPLPLHELTVKDLLLFMVEQLSVSDGVAYFGLMALTTALGLLSPLFTKWLFGDVLESGSITVLLALATFMLCFTVSKACLAAFQALVSARIGTKQDLAVEAAVMGRIFNLPASFFKKYSSGELTQITGYLNSLCSTLFGTVGTGVISSLFSLVYIGQIFSFAPALAVPALLVSAVTALLSLITVFMQMRITKEQMSIAAKTSGMSYSMISGVQKIKLAGAEKRMFARWAEHYSKEARLMYDPPVFLKLSSTVTLAVSLVGTLVMYWCALRSGVTAANYFAFNSAYGMVSAAFMSLTGLAATVANIKPSLELSRPIMEAVPEISATSRTVGRLSGRIELNNISFRYSDDMPNVIDDLSLKIRPGEYLAIVGSTGCGKSTLLRILLGFEKPQKGSVFYDRYELSKVDPKTLRRRIGVVMQDGKLFSGDIFSNITISAPMLTLNEAWAAAEIASVADDIRAMPMGMHTLVSEGQGGISGGQRQRLLIARAVASRPSILMFDEATSALDNLTQRRVSEAIDKLKCTRIVIAHRLSTIRHCDRIIVLDHGKIVEDGTYEELVARNGFFAELVARQRLDVEEA